MKETQVLGWKCSGCGEKFVAADMPLPELVEMWQCGGCGEVYKDREEAKECCRD